VTEFRISKHVRDMLAKRKIPEDVAIGVLAGPEQVVPASEGNLAFQSRINLAGQRLLMRLIVDPYTDPPTVVTVYVTSRISKYWRHE
jgi:hypothetical protein